MFLVALLGSPAHADLGSGAQWLAGTAQGSGSYAQANDISTPFQSTAEALRTFSALGINTSGVPAALPFLAAEPYQNTENLSRLIIAGVQNAQDVSTLITLLLANQDSASGGFGELSGYQPTVLDTAFALEALALSGNAGSPAAGPAIAFLQGRQAADGSWTDGDNAPQIYLTALSLASLRQYANTYSLSSTLQSGSNYLLSARQGDGLWGKDFLSGESLIALLQTLSDTTPVQAGVGTLLAHQGADGSWGDDTFTTAVVLRALGLAQGRGGAANGSGAVQGYVTQAGSSQPIAGATVAVSSIQGLAVQTNASGFFALSGLPPGNLTLVASKAGFSSASAVVAVVAGQSVTSPNLVLSPGTGSGTLRVHLIDSASGTPLGGATVSINGPGGSAAGTTDNSGNVEFDAVAPGSVAVSVQDSGYQAVQAAVTVSGGQILTFTQPLQSSTALSGSGPATLTGTVVDATSGAPIAGAAFALGTGPSASTGANGAFSIGSLNGGSYSASVSAAGYATQTLFVQVPAGITANLGTIRLYPSNSSAAPNAVTLVGTVLDGVSNKPVSGVAVTVAGSALSASSDTSGHFTIANMPSLSFQLQLAAAGYTTTTYTVTASAYGSVSGTFALPPAGAGGTSTNLQGQVTDAASGAAISGATIQITGTSASVQTDANGNYQLPNLSGTQFQVQVSALNYATQNLSVNLSAPGTYTLNVQLNASGSSASSGFQVLSLTANNSGLGANQTQLFTVQVGNQSSASQEGILIGRILDASGKQVATTSPYPPGTQNAQSDFTFAAQEVKTLQIPWNPAQLAPGTYTMELDVVKPGTINRSNPTGTILASNTAYTNVSPTQSFIGTLAFSPPAAQAGSTAPVSLQVLIVNSGNVPLSATPLTLNIMPAGGGNPVETVTTTLAQPLPVAQFAYVPFGSWVPSQSGNLPVSVSSSGSVQGQITGTYYVGDKPTGVFAVTPTDVFTGNQTVHATLDVTGVDKAITVSSPLVYAIKQAVQKGIPYVSTNVRYDTNSAHCLRCHVQSQSYYGLASLLQHDVGSDPATTQFVYNAMANFQRDDGRIDGFGGYFETQAVLTLWALSQTPDKLAGFPVAYKDALYVQSQATTSGGATYWQPDYGSGWWASVDTHTMMAVKGFVDLLLTAQNNNLSTLNDYAASAPVSASGEYNLSNMKPGPDGALYSVEYGANNRIVRYDPATGTTTTAASGLPSYCWGVLPISAKEFYVGCQPNLIHILPDGTQQVIAAISSDPTDVVMGSDGLLYIADWANNRILRGPPNGPFTDYVSGGLLSQPYGLTFGADGALYVANFSGYNILRIAPDRTVSEFAGGLAHRPIYLATAADGAMYGTYYDGEGVWRIDTKGAVRQLFSYNGARGVAIVNGQAYVNSTAGTFEQVLVKTLDTSKLSALSSSVTGAVNHFLAVYNDNSPYNIQQAVRLIGLAEARRVVTDPNLQGQIDQATAAINKTLRARQNADGGWGYNSSYGSDALVTALVGTALDYVPPANDSAVINAVQYLLNTQAADGSWYSANGIMGTRFASTSLVMAYLPRVLDRLGGISVELHVNFPSNIALANPSQPPSGNLPTSDGGTAYTWQLPGVTSQGRAVSFDLNLANMASNESRPAASAAYLLSANSFDNSQVRVDLAIPKVHATDGLTLTQLATDASSYGANSPALISAVVGNVAPASQSGTVVFIIKAADGSVLASLPPVPFTNLAANATIPVSTTWNTGTTLAGTYPVVADLYDSSGALAAEQTTSLAIGASGSSSGGSSGGGSSPTVTLRVTTDKASYNTTDQVRIGDLVRNVSVNSLVPSASLQLVVLDPSGNQVYTATVPLGQLAPSYQRQLSNIDALKAAPVGSYTVNGAVLDRAGHVLATGSTTFQVVEDQANTIVGTERVQYPSVYQGDPQTCYDGVTDRGTLQASALKLQQLVVNLDTGGIDQQNGLTANLAAGGTQSYTRSFTTAGLAVGHHACLIQAFVDGAYKTLANAPFQVQQPPVRVTGNMGLGSRGRLLVLLDDPTTTSATALCKNGLLDLGLQTNFGQPLSATATVTVTLKDSKGKTLDSETATLSGFTGTVDANAGAPVNLAINALTPQSLIIQLNSSNGSGFDGSYRIVVSVSNSSPNFTLDSGTVSLQCSACTAANATVGSFQVISVNSSSGANPGGQGESLTTAQQQSWLQAFLTQNGWSYDLATDKVSFTAKMRSGGYQLYGFYAEYQPLQEQVDKELRELINLGEGLSGTGWPDPNHSILNDLFGVQDMGRQPCPSGVQMSANNVFGLSGQASFTQGQPAQLFTLTGATVDGTVLGNCSSGKPNYLVTHNPYGKGQTALAGFDVLAEASAAGTPGATPGLFGNLILNPLAYVSPPQNPPLAGRVVPLQLTVSNTGIANTTTVQVSSSAGGYIVAADAGTVSNGQLSATLSLNAGESKTLHLWVQTPLGGGQITITAVLTASAGNITAKPVTVTQVLNPVVQPGLQSAINDLGNYVSGQPKQGGGQSPAAQALKALQQASKHLGQGNVQTALSDLIQASDQLIRDGSAAIAPIRLEVDEAIYETEQLQQ